MQFPGYDDARELLRTPYYVLLRARRSGLPDPVLLKAYAHPRASESQELEQEYERLRELASAGVVQAQGLVRFGPRTALVLEDSGLVPLSLRLTEGRPDLPAALRLVRALCTTLADLHRGDLVYNAVHPDSILVAADYGRVQLANFALVRHLPVDARSLFSELLAAGITRTMAPEQSGRVNRSIDHRADLYALGALLYELLTGRPVFDASDPLELIHSHIAKTPVSAAAVCPELPEQVSRLVARLLAKGAEDRYQSATGLAFDLDLCARAWAQRASVGAFPLGARDVSDRFLIPQRLYGRDAELARLSAAFDRAREGHKGLLLVSGYSGVGKTSFIRELCRPIAGQGGQFIAGKFDQVVRNQPYGALIQAFRSLFWLILAQSEERLAGVRAALASALGHNAGVIAEVIPELEFILGEQAPPPELDAAAAQNRFRYVFENFVGTFARPEQPLAIFLDDLQWADAATLDLLHALLTGPDRRHLLVIGAYRDNEVDLDHALTRSARRIEQDGGELRRVQLRPLALRDLVQFVADTLRAEPDDVAALAELIQQKTDGNPFFVIQFLKALHQDGLITFDYERMRWTYKIDAVAAAGITDNVVVLMTRRIRRLSARAQRVLQRAACVGSPFAFETLATVSRASARDLSDGLAEALDAGLIEPATISSERGERSHAFIHDRVQQAAYALIPPEQRPAEHLEVGRLLLAEFADSEVPEERLFAVLDHLNLGSGLLAEHERSTVARLNLLAGRKAKGSAAYQAAWAYLQAATALVRDADFASDYALHFAIHLEAAECQYLAGHFDDAQRAIDRLLERARGPLDRASVHSLRVVANENMSRYGEAVAAGSAGLALFGIELPTDAEALQAALDAELEAIGARLQGRSIAALAELPVMTDESMRMVMRILTSIWAPAYIAGSELSARLISATMVRLSLAHGNTEDSAYGYVTHALTVGPVMRDFGASYEWGELALRVNERFGDSKRRAKIHQQVHAHVKLWSRPFASCIPHAREARQSGLETGDFAYAGYGAATESWPAFLINQELERFVHDHAPHLELLDKLKMSGFRDALRLMLNWARALQGRTSAPCSLTDAHFDENVYRERYQESAPLLLTFLFTARLHLAVLMDDVELGVTAAHDAQRVTMTGTIWPVLADFWGGLALARAADTVDENVRQAYLPRIARAERALGELADHCPENYRCFHLLLAAERTRVAGAPEQALARCEEALHYAQLTDNVQQEALASELCARILLGLGNAARAQVYLSTANRAYARWGATAKQKQLAERYGLARVDAASGARATQERGDPSSAALDVRSVIKVAHAIASEIELDALLSKLMTIALENAGAERGAFVYELDGQLWVQSAAFAEGDPARGAAQGERVTLADAQPEAAADPLLRSIARYVRRTGQDVVLDDVRLDDRFAADAARAASSARSVLCAHVSHQGRSGGILYLENQLSRTFTPDRIEIVRVLAAQAAISLENARLYQAMKSEVARRNQAERELRAALSELEQLKDRLEAENVYLQEEIGTQHNFNEIIGHSPALMAMLRRVELVAPTEATVLITGETGSGKELFARAIHSRSRRSERALVKVNCGAIPPGLVESELFGHVKGAFTGAVEKRTGRFELADGGTIFLDEVGELPAEAQVKLLRVLQEQEFEPVGSSRTVRVDVRVIAATHRNLEQAVREGRFRADLLYRLNVFPLEVPPLRERPTDIPLLIGSFITSLARKLGKPIQGFGAKSLDAMLHYGWPGNVRELQNVVERAAILATGPVLELDRLDHSNSAATVAKSAASGRTATSMDEVQRAHIESVLRATGGVVEGAKGAAALLGMHPNTLRSRMKKLGIPLRSAQRP